jgi:hypothetical protein
MAVAEAVATGFIRKSPEHRAALGRLREWTRARFSLCEETSILVAQVACRLPGCPPLETVINFWVGDTRHHFKVFKPVAAVEADDLPPAWLRPALAVPEGYECDCC